MKKNTRQLIRELITDGVPRTNKMVSELLGIHTSTVEDHMTALVEEGFVTITNIKETTARCIPKIWRYTAAQEGTNPFEWKTYKQWEPS